MLAQIVTTVLGFFLLVLLLRKFFWGTILGLLDDRRRRIEEGFSNIARSKEELSRLQEDYQKRLSQIEEEARSRIQQAALEGKRLALEIQEQARAQGQAVIAKSKETIELELARARIVLRDQLANMTLEAVERILHKKLDEPTDRQIVDAALESLDKEASTYKPTASAS